MTVKELKEQLDKFNDENAWVGIQVLDFGEGAFPIDNVKIDIWENEEGEKTEHVILLQTRLYDEEN